MEKKEAERIVSEKGFFIDESRHPDLGGVKEFGPKYVGKVLVESMRLAEYYESILPYFRSQDRAKEQAIAFFENKYGRIAGDDVRRKLLENTEKVAEVFFLCARDSGGKRVAVVVEKSSLEEVAVSGAGWRPEFK